MSDGHKQTVKTRNHDGTEKGVEILGRKGNVQQGVKIVGGVQTGKDVKVVNQKKGQQ